VTRHEDTARDVIHSSNQIGLRVLDPNWAAGRPPYQSRRRGLHCHDGHGATQAIGPSAHPVEHPQAGRLTGHQTRPAGLPGQERMTFPDRRCGSALTRAASTQRMSQSCGRFNRLQLALPNQGETGGTGSKHDGGKTEGGEAERQAGSGRVVGVGWWHLFNGVR
jgi:hypothetical protein